VIVIIVFIVIFYRWIQYTNNCFYDSFNNSYNNALPNSKVIKIYFFVMFYNRFYNPVPSDNNCACTLQRNSLGTIEQTEK